VVRAARKTEARVAKDGAVAVDFVKTTMKPFSKEQKAEMFVGMCQAMKADARFRKTLQDQMAAKTISEEVFKQRLAKFPRVSFKDAKMTKAASDLIDSTQKLARASGMPDEVLFNNYIPGILEESLEVGFGTRAKFTKFTKLPGSQRKKFVEAGMSQDVEKVFGLRMRQLTTYFHTTRFLKKVIRQFGQKDARKALEEGYMEFFPQNRLRFFRQLNKRDKTIIGVAKAKPEYLPEQVIKTLVDFDKATNLPDDLAVRTFLRGLDGMTQQFKGWVTATWPAFHSRNAFSNRILRFLNEGWKSLNVGDDALAIKILGKSDLDKQITTVAGKKFSLRQIGKWASEERVIGEAGQFGHFDLFHDAARMPSQKITSNLLDWLDPRVSRNNFVKLGRQMGMNIESEARLASFIRGIKDGATRKEAADIAFNGLFDYANLTSFERNVMRRLFPFYTFARKNAGLQMKTLVTNPGRQGVIFKAFNELNGEALAGLNDDELEAFNNIKGEFLRNSFAVPAGINADGDVTWISGFGMPQEELADTLSAQGLWFKINPTLKIPLEQATGISVGRTLGTVREPFGLPDRVIGLKEEYKFGEFKIIANQFFRKGMTDAQLKEFVNDPNGFQVHPLTKLMGLRAVLKPEFKQGRRTGVKKIHFIADPRKVNVLRNIFTARGMTTLRQLGDDDAEAAHQFTRFMTGVTIWNQNMAQSASFQASQTRANVGEELNKVGKGYIFRRAVASDKRAKAFVKRLNKLKP